MKWNFLYQITAAYRTPVYGLPPPDPRSPCPLSSTEFVEPPLPWTKFQGTPATASTIACGLVQAVRLKSVRYAMLHFVIGLHNQHVA